MSCSLPSSTKSVPVDESPLKLGDDSASAETIPPVAILPPRRTSASLSWPSSTFTFENLEFPFLGSIASLLIGMAGRVLRSSSASGMSSSDSSSTMLAIAESSAIRD